MKEKIYYVILDTYNLEFLGSDGYTSMNLEEANKFPDYEMAKNELSTLDEDENFKIYKVEETIKYEFEVMESGC